MAVLQPSLSVRPRGENHVPAPRRPAAARPRAWGCARLPRFLRRITFPIFVTPAIRALAWIRVEGREHLDALSGPVIFACNHQSHLDTHILLEALPSRWRYQTAVSVCDDSYGGGQAWLRAINKCRYAFSVLHLNAFTLPRTVALRGALRHMRWLADRGWSILVFPEGERSSNGALLPFHSGIGIMASLLRLPIVPVRLDGDVLQTSGFGFRPGPVRVRFGDPLRFDEPERDRIAERVEQGIRDLE